MALTLLPSLSGAAFVAGGGVLLYLGEALSGTAVLVMVAGYFVALYLLDKFIS